MHRPGCTGVGGLPCIVPYALGGIGGAGRTMLPIAGASLRAVDGRYGPPGAKWTGINAVSVIRENTVLGFWLSLRHFWNALQCHPRPFNLYFLFLHEFELLSKCILLAGIIKNMRVSMCTCNSLRITCGYSCAVIFVSDFIISRFSR